MPAYPSRSAPSGDNRLKADVPRVSKSGCGNPGGAKRSFRTAALLRLIPENLRASLSLCKSRNGMRDWVKVTRDKLASQLRWP
jgi:hypothetical protein